MGTFPEEHPMKTWINNCSFLPPSSNCQKHSHCTNLKLQISTGLLPDFPMSYEIPLIQFPLQTIQDGNPGVKKQSQYFCWIVSFLKLHKQVWKSPCWDCSLDTAQGLHLRVSDWKGIFQNAFVWVFKKYIWNIISSYKV